MEVYRIVVIFVLSLFQFSYAEDSATIIHPKDRKILPGNVRIVGGQEAERNSFPFQAALYITKAPELYFCGGTLVSNTWVLTAAHCVKGASKVEVRLGVHNILNDTNETTQVRLTSTEFIIHRAYVANLFWNDVALIKLPRNVAYNDYIQPVQFVEYTNETFAESNGTVIGWGKTQYGELSSVLKYVNVSIISNEECAIDSTLGPYIIDSIMCTSGEGFVGSCSGDSGGPLIHDGVQVGIVSFGSSNCVSGNRPSAYTRVSKFSEWISDAIAIDAVNGSTAAFPIDNFFAVVVSFAVFLICNF